MIWQCWGTEFFSLCSSYHYMLKFCRFHNTWPRHHQSTRISLASIILKERQDKRFGFWWSSTCTSVEKKLHVQLWNEGVMFFCHIFVCHSKLKQTTYGSVEQWGNLNETDKHIANISIVIKIKADRLRYMYIKICYFFHKNGIGMYKCTRKLQLHEKKI